MAEAGEIDYTNTMAHSDPTPDLKYIVMSPPVLLAALTEVADNQRSPEEVMLYLLDNAETHKFEVRPHVEDPG
ncbi:hypothetical protein LCGC14_1727100 [marine sediment metagenome]|uniref:Uncharacterized protein n=1 Tax=marine sediment metagenome TaxID=412755 RepID=A0A0F9HYF5_9ZZZZ